MDEVNLDVAPTGPLGGKLGKQCLCLCEFKLSHQTDSAVVGHNELRRPVVAVSAGAAGV